MGSEIQVAERHPIKTLIRISVIAGLLYAAAKFLMDKKAEFMDLTESQAREKFMAKVSPKLGEEQASEIADQVISKLKERGIVRPDTVDTVDPAEATETADV